ncbi:MAG: hypothetical protein AB1473_05465 [Thermodesulfobacteriota bacterium]
MRDCNQVCNHGRDRPKQTLEFGVITIVTVFVLSVCYVTRFQPWSYGRYFAPLVLPGALCTVVALSAFADRCPKLVLAVLCLTTVSLMATTFWHRGETAREGIFYSEQLPLVRRLVPGEEYVGAFRSGTLGYSREKVVNLDGKVNHEVFAYKGRIGHYLLDRTITWVCDWEINVKALCLEKPEGSEWRIIARKGNFFPWHFEENSASAVSFELTQNVCLCLGHFRNSQGVCCER